MSGTVSEPRTGTPSEHDEAELDRGREQDEGHDDPRHDGARESRETVVGAADAHGVGRDGVDDVARGNLVGEGRAGRGDVPSDRPGSVRYVAFIQLVTASWWRSDPQTAWNEPRTTTTANPLEQLASVVVARRRGRWRRRRPPRPAPGPPSSRCRRAALQSQVASADARRTSAR